MRNAPSIDTGGIHNWFRPLHRHIAGAHYPLADIVEAMHGVIVVHLSVCFLLNAFIVVGDAVENFPVR